MVLTEPDYKYFNEFPLNKNYDSPDFLPTAIRLTMTNNTLLFLGYTIDDWKFDVLLNWINSFMFVGRDFYQKILIHPMIKGEQQQDIQRYFERKKIGKVNIYWGSVGAFAQELRDHWKSLK
jgi:hypothetical protein